MGLTPRLVWTKASSSRAETTSFFISLDRAPAPTTMLHLINYYSSLINWLLPSTLGMGGYKITKVLWLIFIIASELLLIKLRL